MSNQSSGIYEIGKSINNNKIYRLGNKTIYEDEKGKYILDGGKTYLPNNSLSNNGFVNMYDDKGNNASVNLKYLSEYLNKGYTFDKPENVVFYNPNGTGFTTGTNAKYWRDNAANSGYTGIASVEQFQPIIDKIMGGNAITPDELSQYISSVNTNNSYQSALDRKLNGINNSNNNAFINNTTNSSYMTNNTINSSYMTNNTNSNLTSNNNTTLNTSNGILLNPNDPNGGVVYKTNNGMVLEVNGQQVEITEDEFIKFMTEYLGF